MNLERYWCDIRGLEPDSRIFAGARYVFHFAGIGDIVPSIERPTEYMDVNVQGTVRVLECARTAGVEKFVYAASSSCYGLAATPTREDHPIAPQYPYALSKYQGEQASFHWRQVYGLPVNAVCIFNAYGPRVRTTGVYGAVFGVFFRQKLASKPFTVVGDGTQTRDFIFVTDVAAAFLRGGSAHSRAVHPGQAQLRASINRLVESARWRRRGICRSGPVSRIAKFRFLRYSGESHPLLEVEAVCPLRRGVKRMLADIERWRRAAAVGSRIGSLKQRAHGLSIWVIRGMICTFRCRCSSGIATRSRPPRSLREILAGPPPRKHPVMRHGVFDVVHPGHVRHLLYAKSKADVLIASPRPIATSRSGATACTFRNICAR